MEEALHKADFAKRICYHILLSRDESCVSSIYTEKGSNDIVVYFCSFNLCSYLLKHLSLIVIKCFLLAEMTQNRKSHYSGLQGLMRRPSCSTAPTMSVGVFDREVVPAIHGRGVQVWDVREHNHENGSVLKL